MRAPRYIVSTTVHIYRCLKWINFESNFNCNHCNPNIVYIAGALFTLGLSILILNFQYDEGARDGNNIRVTMVIWWGFANRFNLLHIMIWFKWWSVLIEPYNSHPKHRTDSIRLGLIRSPFWKKSSLTKVALLRLVTVQPHYNVISFNLATVAYVVFSRCE